MKKIRCGDILAVIVILAAAFSIMAFGYKNGGGQTVAVIKQNDEIIKKIALDGLTDEISFTVQSDGGQNIITAQNGKIAFTKATCKHQTCVQTGWINRAGQVAVCLENKVSITIEGKNVPDAVAK